MTYTITDVIDFAALGTAVAPMITAALGAAVVIGAAVYVARLGWRLFKGMGRG